MHAVLATDEPINLRNPRMRARDSSHISGLWTEQGKFREAEESVEDTLASGQSGVTPTPVGFQRPSS